MSRQFDDTWGFAIEFQLSKPLDDDVSLIVTLTRPDTTVVTYSTDDNTVMIDDTRTLVKVTTAEGDIPAGTRGTYLTRLIDVTSGRQLKTPIHQFSVEA